MKRLIKKSEFYTAEQQQGQFLECYRDPTAKEWETIYSEFEGIRGIITPTGTVYIWSADLLHSDAIPLFGIEDGIHFDCNGKSLIWIFVNAETNAQDLQNAFKSADSLYNYFTRNTRIGGINTSYYESTNYNMYDNVNTIEDIINYDPKSILEEATV